VGSVSQYMCFSWGCRFLWVDHAFYFRSGESEELTCPVSAILWILVCAILPVLQVLHIPWYVQYWYVQYCLFLNIRKYSGIHAPPGQGYPCSRLGRAKRLSHTLARIRASKNLVQLVTNPPQAPLTVTRHAAGAAHGLDDVHAADRVNSPKRISSKLVHASISATRRSSRVSSCWSCSACCKRPVRSWSFISCPPMLADSRRLTPLP
jgi:hypothetical protein